MNSRVDEMVYFRRLIVLLNFAIVSWKCSFNATKDIEGSVHSVNFIPLAYIIASNSTRLLKILPHVALATPCPLDCENYSDSLSTSLRDRLKYSGIMN